MYDHGLIEYPYTDLENHGQSCKVRFCIFNTPTENHLFILIPACCKCYLLLASEICFEEVNILGDNGRIFPDDTEKVNILGDNGRLFPDDTEKVNILGDNGRIFPDDTEMAKKGRIYGKV